MLRFRKSSARLIIKMRLAFPSIYRIKRFGRNSIWNLTNHFCVQNLHWFEFFFLVSWFVWFKFQIALIIVGTHSINDKTIPTIQQRSHISLRASFSFSIYFIIRMPTLHLWSIMKKLFQITSEVMQITWNFYINLCICCNVGNLRCFRAT